MPAPTTAQHSQIRTPPKFSSYGELSESESEPEPVNENTFDPAATVGVAEVNHSDLDAQMLTNHMNEQFAPVVRSLVDNFIDVKLRILKEHAQVCSDKDQMYTTKIRKMQEVIDTLREDLATSQLHIHSLQSDKLKVCQVQAERHAKMAVTRGAFGPSLLNIIKKWNAYSKEKKVEKKTDNIAMLWSKKHKTQKMFQAWVHFTLDSKKERTGEMHDAKLETVTREIITRYESELAKLRVNLKEAHQEIARGHVQRNQLEEKMRRTFLKGMTAMNMEALQLFNQAAVNNTEKSFSSEQSPMPKMKNINSPGLASAGR